MMERRVILALLLILILPVCTPLSLPEKYESETRPNGKGVADVINVSLKVLAVNKVDAEDQSVSLDLRLDMFWTDKRLADLVERDTIFSSKLPDVWLPHLAIGNTAEAPDRSDRSLKLKPDGTLDLSEKISAKVNCKISMLRYPFSKQHCNMQIHTNGYSTVHLLLFWNGMIFSSEVPTFDPEYSIFHLEQTSKRERTISGEYSRLNVEISFVRSSFRLILLVLLPTFVLAVVSYFITFFMGSPDTIKARKNSIEEDDESQHTNTSLTLTYILFDIIRLTVNAFLLLIVVLVNQVHFLKSPRSSSPTALDIWTASMSFNIFICGLLSLQICFKKWKNLQDGDVMRGQTQKGRCDWTLKTVLHFFRIAIPVVFLIFLIAFLALCLSIGSKE